jgi:hypothetical protein
MSIRTTVTLNEQVLEMLHHEARARGISFRETLDDVIRAGLEARTQAPVRRTLRVDPAHMGTKPGLNYDDIAGLLEYGEGGLHR